MLFSEEFLLEIRDDPVNSIVNICQKVLGSVGNQRDWTESDYAYLLEGLALLSELIDARLLTADIALPEISGVMELDCGGILDSVREVERVYSSEASKLRLQAFRGHFRQSLGGGFCYEFSQGDLSRIQTLINELRSLVVESQDFESGHKDRLLKRLEKLQLEVHKKVADLDRFWGLIGDAGVVIGKFGNDAKPLVDRMKEIAEIVWRTQSRAEELPSGTPSPLLEHKDLSSQ